jgi:hypothetical protein
MKERTQDADVMQEMVEEGMNKTDDGPPAEFPSG